MAISFDPDTKTIHGARRASIQEVYNAFKELYSAWDLMRRDEFPFDYDTTREDGVSTYHFKPELRSDWSIE